MIDVILVVNAGSSSIKFSAFDAGSDSLALISRGQVEGLFNSPRFVAYDGRGDKIGEHAWGNGVTLEHEAALAHLGAFLRGQGVGHRLVAVGHRVVHGGVRFTAPVRVTHTVLAELERLTPLAPLHQPHNLRPISALMVRQPDLPQIACFDTAFHATQSEVTRSYALPDVVTQHGVRRYGFHGLSYEYIAQQLPRIAPRAAQGRTVVAHLGNGASLCAMAADKSVATTMGFTALDGLVMGTRCGSIDPGVLLFMLDELGMDARQIEDLLYRQSGLVGVSGISGDMRTLAASDSPRAAFAIDLYVDRINCELGSMIAALQGIDALVFTAGVGEHSAEIRRRVGALAGWCGVEIDPQANDANATCISTPASKVEVYVVPTNEELMIARHARAMLG
jgi:acetate kinase